MLKRNILDMLVTEYSIKIDCYDVKNGKSSGRKISDKQIEQTNERKINIEEKHARRTYQRNKVDKHMTKIYTRNIRTRKK